MTKEQATRLRKAAAKAADGLAARNRVIRELHSEGVGLREIARELGMTHPGIRKIIQRTEEP